MSKAKRIQALLKSGKSIKEVAKATKSSEAYVYYVRWTEKKRGETTPKKAKKKAQFKSPRSRLVQDIFQKNYLNYIKIGEEKIYVSNLILKIKLILIWI